MDLFIEQLISQKNVLLSQKKNEGTEKEPNKLEEHFCLKGCCFLSGLAGEQTDR